MAKWSDFDQFDDICHEYLPIRGEGDSMATQIVTAITKLVYKYYNDGDVFDNTYYLEGWANDLSSYANWLFTYIPLKELEEIYEIRSEEEYSNLLYRIANKCMNEEFLRPFTSINKKGSIYDCDGPFKFEEHNDDDEGFYDNEEE